MTFPLISTIRTLSYTRRAVAVALIGLSTPIFWGCNPAEQQTGDLHILKVPTVHVWGSKPFPALDKTLAGIEPGKSVQIALDFPQHPGGYPYPQPIGSSGVKIDRGSVRFSAGDAYIVLLPGKRVLYKAGKDTREVALHYAPQSDYDIHLGVGGLAAWGSSLILDDKGEDANGNRGVAFEAEEHGTYSRIRLSVECSTDFAGSFGNYFVWQPQ